MSLKEEGDSQKVTGQTSASESSTLPECMKAVEKVMDSKGKGRKEVQSETNVREVAEMECVVISDDESDFLTENYLSKKRPRVISSEDRDGASEGVVILTDEDQPGPSYRDNDRTLTPQPPTARVDLTPGAPNPIPVYDDDEPVITNIIDPIRDDRSDPVTWQLVRSDDSSVRRSGLHARYRARRPAAPRRSIRPREYGDFMRFVRDLTNDGVVIRSQRPMRSHNGGQQYHSSDVNFSRPLSSRSGATSRGFGSSSRSFDAASRSYDTISRSFDSTARSYDTTENSWNGNGDAGTAASDVSGDSIIESLSREALETSAREFMGSSEGSTMLSTFLRGRGHDELFRMNGIRDRITTLRRDLQNLNGLLTSSFQLLNRISPYQSLPRIDKSVLDRAPTKLVTAADVSREKACSICLGKYVEGDVLRVLPCDHEFHEACIDRWLINCSCKCPFCRTDIQEALQSML